MDAYDVLKTIRKKRWPGSNQELGLELMDDQR